MFGKKIILGIGFTDEKIGNILEYIEEIVKKRQKKYLVFTPNPEILVMADDNLEYKKVINSADLALIDGMGIVIAGKILGIPLKNRITGIDLLENLCSYVVEKPITVGFLGGRAGVAEEVSDCLTKKYPGLKVAFSAEELENSSLREHVDILFVAFGSPKQELWLSKNIKNLPITVGIGVGGAFDMISGRVWRAPKILRDIGLEWLFRLIVQPWRIKRQLRLLTFLKLVIAEKFSHSY